MNIETKTISTEDVPEALVNLSNNDQKIIEAVKEDFQQFEVVLAKIGNRLEYLSRILDKMFISTESTALKSMTEAEYREICNSILEKMINEVRQSLPV